MKGLETQVQAQAESQAMTNAQLANDLLAVTRTVNDMDAKLNRMMALMEAVILSHGKTELPPPMTYA